MPSFQAPPDLVDKILKIAGAVLIVLVGVLGWFLRNQFKHYDEDIRKLEKKAEDLTKKLEEALTSMTQRVDGYRAFFIDGTGRDMREEINELKNEWADLRAHIPEHYLPRQDFIRDNTILDGKISALFRKFDRVEVKLDFLVEHLEKGSASNGESA